MVVLPGTEMKEPVILNIEKDLSIPWFEQIKKTIRLHDHAEPQIYYSIKPQDYVTVLAQTGEKKIIVLKQYRPAIEDYTFEFPSGHLEDGETPLQGVLRELKEETGGDAGEVTLLGELIPDTGRLENSLWAFYADNIMIKNIPHPDENEGIEIHLVSPEELLKMINRGAFRHALDLGVLTLAIAGKYFKL